MFTLAQPAYHFYNPYEELAMQQELQRRRQIDAYLRRQREAEEIEWRRRQYEAAVRAEYERRQEAEVERRRQAELQRRREAQKACGRHSVYDGGLESLFDALYGGRSQSRPCDDQQEAHHTTHKSPTPVPVSTPAPVPTPIDSEPTPEPELEEPQVDTAPSYAAVQSILSSFTTLQSDFAFPARLDFQHGSSKLAYTPNNAPLHGYEHALTGLLTQLDAVESYGNDGVRRARKEAVKTIERELERLDGMKAEAWKGTNEPELELSESVAAGRETEVDPLLVPLPEDEDVQVQEMEGVSQTAVAEDSDSLAASPPSMLEQSLVSAQPTQPEPSISSGIEYSTSLEHSVDVDPTPVSMLPGIGTELPLSENTALITPLPQTPTFEPLAQLPSSSFPPEVSARDSTWDHGLEEYVEIEMTSTPENKGTYLEEVEKDSDLELMPDWDLEF